MRFDDEVNTLARAIGHVLADGPTAKRLRGVEPPVAMVARDAVVGELRSLAGVLLADADRRLAATDPLHMGLTQLHRALAALPTASRDGFSLADALAIDTQGYSQRWQFAAKAAVQLEIYHDVVVGPHALSTAQSLAALAATVHLLDADLVRALPSGSLAGVTDHPAHSHIGLAVTRVLKADKPSLSNSPERPFLPRLLPVRGLGAVPGATRHLAALVERRGPEITAQEFRAVMRTVLEGAALAVQRSPALSDALPPLQKLLGVRLATMTEPSRRVLNLAAEIRHATTSGRAGEVFDVQCWLKAAGSAIVAATSSLEQAAVRGLLLSPSNSPQSLVASEHMWVRDPWSATVIAGRSSQALLVMRGLETNVTNVAATSRSARTIPASPARH